MEKLSPSHNHSGAIKLPPGFRFHPTDEELVVQYLRRKAFSCPLPAAIIPEIDLGKYNPWDLPGGECERERYFFAVREAKYRNGSGRSNRATGCGYWKATGKDRAVAASRSSQVVGMKKTLVFYRGKAPTGSTRTDWVMHEYRLAGSPQRKNSTNSAIVVPPRDWVLCRIFTKKRADRRDVDEHGENRHVGYIDFFGRQSDDRRWAPPSPTDSDSSCVTEAAEESSNGDDTSPTT